MWTGKGADLGFSGGFWKKISIIFRLAKMIFRALPEQYKDLFGHLLENFDQKLRFFSARASFQS